MEHIEKQTIMRLCVLEALERFGYYGMRALLVLFMINHLRFNEGNSYLIYGLFAAICYIIPVLGGVLADRFFGYKKLIHIGAVFLCIGYAVLTSGQFLFMGLSFVAVGTGFFKGNVTNIFGSICDQHPGHHRDTHFRKFYISVNLGSFLGASVCGIIAHQFGWTYGFMTAGLVMGCCFILFLFSKELLKNDGNPEKPSSLKEVSLYILGAVLVLISTLMFYHVDLSMEIISGLGILILLHLGYTLTQAQPKERQVLSLILTLLLFLLIVFAIEMQLGSFINVFTDRYIDKTFLDITIPTASLQSLNPLAIILLGIIVTFLLKKQTRPSSLKIFGAGLGLNIFCFFTLFIGCLFFQSETHLSDERIPLSFLVLSMGFMALGEILMGPIIQSVVTGLSPKGMKGYMMGITMLSLSYANILGSIILKKMLLSTPVGVGTSVVTSMDVYQNIFLQLTIFFLVCTVLYFLLYKKMNQIFLENKS